MIPNFLIYVNTCKLDLINEISMSIYELFLLNVYNKFKRKRSIVVKTSFQKINRGSTLSSEIVLAIKDQLLKGHLKPGDKLPTEQELMKQFGVSRTPIREAIKTLEAIGIIQIKRGEGMFITKDLAKSHLNPLIFSLIMHRNDLKKLIEFRQHFEILMMTMIISKQDKEVLSELEEVYQSQKKKMKKHMTPEELVEIDLEFHKAVLKATENPFVIEIGQTIYEIIKPKMIHFKHKKNIERTLQTHRHYLDILKGKKPFDAISTAEQMIKNNAEMIENINPKDSED